MAATRSNELPGPSPRLVYPWRQPPQPGEIVSVAAGVGWLRMPLPFALDHINLWVLEDTDGWTLVDTGVARAEVKVLWRRLLEGPLASRRPVRLVVTHHHPDHVGLAGWLGRETGTALWMARDEWLTAMAIYGDVEERFLLGQIELFRQNGLDAKRLETLAARGNTYRRLVSAPPSQFRRLTDGEVLQVNGRSWRVIVGTGHAPEHACLYCEELGVLIAGDQILPGITPNVSLPASEPDANPLASFLESTARLRALPERTLVLPSHGLPFHGLHARVAQLISHHEARLEALVEACEEPRSAAELLPVLFRRKLDAHQLRFAMGESLSHLVYLVAAGNLLRECGADGLVRFRRARGA